MWYLKTNKLFYTSLLLGLLVWLFVFIILPVEVVEQIELKTILFIVLNYLSLVIGFMCFNFKDKNKVEHKQYKTLHILKMLIAIVAISYLIRYIDLFFIRNMSFGNNVFTNRVLSARDFEFKHLFFVLAAVLKSLYFFPIVIVLSTSLKNKWIVIASYTLLFLPLIEALLKGSRKPFFDIAIILVFSILVFTKIKLTKKKIVFTIFGAIALLMATNLILFNRETKEDKNIYNQILAARYNDLLKPSKKIKNYILNDSTPEINKRTALTLLHVGQYVTHGFFEFNHIVKGKPIPLTYGAYTFSPFGKLFNKENVNPSPREYVYVTAFGGLYLDFGWFSLIIMLFFGAFQKLVFQKAINSVIWRPVLSYLLIINVFLPVFNYVRGAGVYPLVSFFIILLILKTTLLRSNEKSINT